MKIHLTTLTKVLMIVGLLIMLACHPIKDKFNSMVGQPKKELILKFGPPDKIIEQEDGDKIYLYTSQYYNQGMKINRYYYRFFFINNNGIVYHWTEKYSTIPPNELDVNVFLH